MRSSPFFSIDELSSSLLYINYFARIYHVVLSHSTVNEGLFLHTFNHGFSVTHTLQKKIACEHSLLNTKKILRRTYFV